jgi:serine phosphatase RsbU (regulator of sigma subunit)
MDELVRSVRGGLSFSVSAVVGRWNAVGSTLTWVACGHAPPLLVAPDGTVEELHGHRYPVLGRLDPQRAVRCDERRLHPGERVVLYSDGITERPLGGGGAFGLDGIRAAVAAARGASAARMVRALQQAVVAASARPLEDDAALMVLSVG